MRRFIAGCLMSLSATLWADEPVRTNWFNDPFQQLSHGLANCPPAAPPLLTEKEATAEAHSRIERGNSCWNEGRCRYSSSYAYDREIMARVVQSVIKDGRFQSTSVWALGQRRWVWLKGCVNTREEADNLVRFVRSIDDVQEVIDQLSVGVGAVPRYEIIP